jgi:rubrerythrin
MGLRSALSGFLPGDTTEEVVECRQCGTTIETETDACPECGGTEFSRYVISR